MTKKTITLTQEQFDKLFCGEDVDDFEVIEVGGWICNEKHDERTIIISKDNKFYSISNSRKGCPYSEYTYGSEYGTNHLEAVEVKKIEVMTHKWKNVT